MKVGCTNVLSCPSTVFGSTSTISRFGERFRDGHWPVSYSFVILLFVVFLQTCQAIYKSGGGASAPVPYGVGAGVNMKGA